MAIGKPGKNKTVHTLYLLREISDSKIYRPLASVKHGCRNGTTIALGVKLIGDVTDSHCRLVVFLKWHLNVYQNITAEVPVRNDSPRITNRVAQVLDTLLG